MFPLILASASPRRADILRKAGLDFKIIPSHSPEPGALFAEDAALENAFVKANDIAEQNPEALVLGADTVIEMDGQIFGKPKDASDAFQMLRRFSGKTHIVTTGCALICRKEKTEIRFAELSAVTFRELADEVIHRYLVLTDVMDKAGAYAIQEHGELLISAISGDRENIVGLPLRAIDSIRYISTCFKS